MVVGNDAYTIASLNCMASTKVKEKTTHMVITTMWMYCIFSVFFMELVVNGPKDSPEEDSRLIKPHASDLASVPGLPHSVRVLIKRMRKHSKLAQLSNSQLSP